jgi:hypothetical protein
VHSCCSAPAIEASDENKIENDDMEGLEKFFVPTRLWKMTTERVLNIILAILWLRDVKKKRQYTAAYNVAKGFMLFALRFTILERL